MYNLILLSLLTFSLQAFSAHYCLTKLEFASTRRVEITQTCNGKKKTLFKPGFAIDKDFFVVNTLQNSYPIEDVSEKVESYSASVLLKRGHELIKTKKQDNTITFTTLK